MNRSVTQKGEGVTQVSLSPPTREEMIEELTLFIETHLPFSMLYDLAYEEHVNRLAVIGMNQKN